MQQIKSVSTVPVIPTHVLGDRKFVSLFQTMHKSFCRSYSDSVRTTTSLKYDNDTIIKSNTAA